MPQGVVAIPRPLIITVLHILLPTRPLDTWPCSKASLRVHLVHAEAWHQRSVAPWSDILVPKQALVHHVQSKLGSVVPVVRDARAGAVAQLHHHVRLLVAQLLLPLPLAVPVSSSTPCESAGHRAEVNGLGKSEVWILP